MIEGGKILFLDLATSYGWAEGSPGGSPVAGSGRFTAAGASHAKVGAEALVWFADRLALEAPAVVFIERPGLHSVAQGKSSFDVIYRLLGLAFLFGAVAHRRGVYDVRFVKAEEVRLHFLGSKSLKGDVAKRRTEDRCRDLGWAFKNNDESDALAGWDYACEQIRRGSGHPAAAGLFASDAAPKVRRPKAAAERISAAAARDLFRKGGRK